MKKFLVIIPALFALAGCLQGGTGPLATCATGTDACLQATVADMAAAPAVTGSVPGENNRDGAGNDRSSARADSGNASNAGSAGNGGNTGAAGDDDDDDDKGKAGDDDDDDDNGKAGDDDDKGDKGNKGDHRNQNANEKGDNKDDKAGNADDAHS